MNWSFRNRIAWVNTIAVAILMAIVFLVIYSVVHYSSYKHLDDDIRQEKSEILQNLHGMEDGLHLKELPDWDEDEHMQLVANPTFIQIVNAEGEVIYRSTNLRNEKFLFKAGSETDYFFNAIANGQRLRFGQFPILENGRLMGQLTVAVSQQESFVVLRNLRLILVISYLFLLIALFAILWYVASRAILPVTQLSRAASAINESSIGRRLPLPETRDEIFQLGATINDLLQRLELAMLQQKQFTADVSHEMRTPLTAIKGTLEVILRRERTPEHYEEKIRLILAQTNRLNSLYDQMLTLAKIDAGSLTVKKEKVALAELVTMVFNENTFALQEKKISAENNIPDDTAVPADRNLLEIILNNLLTNAIKYNAEHGRIEMTWLEDYNTLTVKDSGIGIPEDQLPHIFDRFYRADSSRGGTAKGFGLGLSIVKKLCDLQDIKITASSSDEGSVFSLQWPLAENS